MGTIIVDRPWRAKLQLIGRDDESEWNFCSIRAPPQFRERVDWGRLQMVLPRILSGRFRHGELMNYEQVVRYKYRM